MLASDHLYLYLWQHRFWDPDQDQLICRVCFGITSDPDNRRNGYEGHVGHPVIFQHLWKGPDRLIRELEAKIKTDFQEHLWSGHRGFEYEWLTEEITMEQILGWVDYEVQDLDTVVKVSDH
jgi:hypothetical protein